MIEVNTTHPASQSKLTLAKLRKATRMLQRAEAFDEGNKLHFLDTPASRKFLIALGYNFR